MIQKPIVCTVVLQAKMNRQHEDRRARCSQTVRRQGQCPGQAFLLSARSDRHPIASGLRCIMDGVVLATSEELVSSEKSTRICYCRSRCLWRMTCEVRR